MSGHRNTRFHAPLGTVQQVSGKLFGASMVQESLDAPQQTLLVHELHGGGYFVRFGIVAVAQSVLSYVPPQLATLAEHLPRNRELRLISGRIVLEQCGDYLQHYKHSLGMRVACVNDEPPTKSGFIPAAVRFISIEQLADEPEVHSSLYT